MRWTCKLIWEHESYNRHLTDNDDDSEDIAAYIAYLVLMCEQ